MTCYLHIGVPKTGTTSVQNFLYTNRQVLQKQGFLYPVSALHTHQHAALVSIINSYSENQISKKRLSEWLDALKQEILSYPNHTILFSSEVAVQAFDSVTKISCLKEILQELGFTKIYIVVYFRNCADTYVSLYSQVFKMFTMSMEEKEKWNTVLGAPQNNLWADIHYKYQMSAQNFAEVFGKDKMIVRFFDKAEFVQGDLIRDFLDAVGLHWDSAFVLPKNQNESLDLLGMEIAKALYKHDFPEIRDDIIASKIYEYTTKSLTSKDPNLKFMPPKELYESYLNFYAESNEWVRTEFFPQRQSLFPPKDLSTYKENYELREMKPEYWDRIAQFVADILIDSINAHNTLSTRKPTNFIQADSALAHVQNELPYKLGEALAQNTKSFWGFICLPFVLSYIKNGHNAKQRIYEQELAQGNAPAIPPLSSYPDYEEALKLQRSFLYSLGKALIVYNNKGEAKLSYLSFIRKVLSSIKRNKGVRKQLTHLSSEQ